MNIISKNHGDFFCLKLNKAIEILDCFLPSPVCKNLEG